MKKILWIIDFTIALLIVCLCLPMAAAADASTPAPASALSSVSTDADSVLVAQNSADAEDDIEMENDEDFDVADPLFYWNSVWFHFNDKLYFWVLKPVAKGYKTVMPSFVRIGVRNFFHNLAFPLRFAGCMLQAKVDNAGRETVRFLMNSTIGVAGFMNPAKDNHGLNPPAEDVGQALAVWGVGEGIYLVWPFFGPSNARDTLGLVAEYFLNPVTYIALTDGEGLFKGDARYWAWGVKSYQFVNETSFRIGDYEALKEAALDPYVAIRDAYTQNRNKDIRE
ncbi:MAG: VacJ family lipoprotein [Deltaproteobacteria bacterium]|nr:VacJ family lipoprotein [Deltaproteobacteria bacterium]